MGLFLVPLLTVSGRSLATDFEVRTTTALQGYEIADPWGDVILARRRFTQTIGLGVYNLQGAHRPGEADVRVALQLRLNSDFGVNADLPASRAGGETTYATPTGNGVRFIPGLQDNPVDLMYGYVEGRNLAHGLVGFRLGRQYVADALGWWSFDGGLVRVTTPVFLQVEAYGGAEQRGGLPLSTSRFEAQGMWRGSHSAFGTAAGLPAVTDYPSYVYAEPAPAFGVAVETVGPTWIHGRASYRRVYNTGAALTAQFPGANTGGYPTMSGLRISRDRFGFGGDLSKPALGSLKGGMTYDLYNQIVASYFAGIEGHAGKHVTVGADVDYFVPTFDADSIWNWFTRSPNTTITGRAAFRFHKRFEITASTGVRLWSTEGDASARRSTLGLSGFGAGECAALNRVAGGATSTCSLGAVSLDPTVTAVQGYAQDPVHRATFTVTDAMANLAGRYRGGSADISLRSMLQAGPRGNREGADLAAETRLDGGRFTLASRVSVYGWADPTRPDRDAVSFSYVLAAAFRPAGLADYRVEWEHDMSRLVGQRYRIVALVNLLMVK